MDPYYVIRDAILNKHSIVAQYNGHVRELSPHVLGRKRGRDQALCYQYGGTSSSGPLAPSGSPDNWRCIAVLKLENVRVVPDVWHSAPHDTRPTTCVDVIEVEVANDA